MWLKGFAEHGPDCETQKLTCPDHKKSVVFYVFVGSSSMSINFKSHFFLLFGVISKDTIVAKSDSNTITALNSKFLL